MKDNRVLRPDDLDPQEIVTLPSVGKAIPLRIAVADVMSHPVATRGYMRIFRKKGKQPTILDIADVVKMATWPGFLGSERD